MNYQGQRKVVLITTGGTIASNINPETGLLASGLITGEELSSMCDLPNHIQMEVISVFEIPSNQMTFKHLLLLKEKIEEIFRDEDVDGIVVTHGTDTIEETSYFLDLTIADQRPVVLTGSQRSPSAIGTDAYINLRQSILLAASPECEKLGTIVLFNGKIFPARYVTKSHTSNVDGFTSSEFGYLGMIDEDDIIVYQKKLKKDMYSLRFPIPYVEIIKCSLGTDGKLIDHLVELGAKGIVVEGFGRGHVPLAVGESMKVAVQRGVKVILTSSCAEGNVKTVYDTPGTAYQLQQAGVVLGKDYESKKARIKLAVALASDILNIAEEF